MRKYESNKELYITPKNHIERKMSQKNIGRSPLLEKLQKIAEHRVASNVIKIKAEVQQRLQEHIAKLNQELNQRIEKEKSAIKLECSREVKLGYNKAAVQCIKADVEKMLYGKLRAQIEPGIKAIIKTQITTELEGKYKANLDKRIKEYKKHVKAEFEEKKATVKKRLEDAETRKAKEAILEKEGHLRRIGQGLYEQDTKEIAQEIFSKYEEAFNAELEEIERERIELIGQKAVYAKKVKECENTRRQKEKELQRKELEIRRDEIDFQAGKYSVPYTPTQKDISLIVPPKSPVILSEEVKKVSHRNILPDSRQLIESALQKISFDQVIKTVEKNAVDSEKSTAKFLISSPEDINEFDDYYY